MSTSSMIYVAFYQGAPVFLFLGDIDFCLHPPPDTLFVQVFGIGNMTLDTLPLYSGL